MLLANQAQELIEKNTQKLKTMYHKVLTLQYYLYLHIES